MKTIPSLLRAALCTGAALSFATLSSTAGAQRNDLADVVTAVVDANDGGAAKAPAVATVATLRKSPEDKPLLGRWLELDALSHSERYRDAFPTGGIHIWENAQQRSLIAGKFKFDPEGRYTIGFRASSGGYFNWSFASYTGESLHTRTNTAAFGAAAFTPAALFEIGQAYFVDPTGQAMIASVNSNGWQFYLRELYVSATPVKRITVEFGSFGIEHGYGSEITTFDDDGYIAGERIAVHSPKQLFFDEIKLTNAYFGDFATVNFLDRGARLKSNNYRQVSGKKKLNERVAFSADYTWMVGTDTLREAVVVKTNELKVIDSVRFESYQRLNTVTLAGGVWPYGVVAPLPVKGGSGFAVALNEKFGRLSGDVGYADVDQDYSIYGGRYFHAAGFTLNGDTISTGKHPFAHAAVRIAPGVSAVGFYTHGLDDHGFDTNVQGWTAGMSFDLKAMVNSEKRVF
jgi:hypothetical protein